MPTDSMAWATWFEMVVYQPTFGNPRYIHFAKGIEERDSIGFPLYSDVGHNDPRRNFECFLDGIIERQNSDSTWSIEDDVLLVPRTMEGIDLGHQTILEYDKMFEKMLTY